MGAPLRVGGSGRPVSLPTPSQRRPAPARSAIADSAPARSVGHSRGEAVGQPPGRGHGGEDRVGPVDRRGRRRRGQRGSRSPGAWPGPAGSRTTGWSGRGPPRRRPRRRPRNAPSRGPGGRPRCSRSAGPPRRAPAPASTATSIEPSARQRATARPPARARSPRRARRDAAPGSPSARHRAPAASTAASAHTAARRSREIGGPRSATELEGQPGRHRGHRSATAAQPSPGTRSGGDADPEDPRSVGVDASGHRRAAWGRRRTTSSRDHSDPHRPPVAGRPGGGPRRPPASDSLPPKAPPLA